LDWVYKITFYDKKAALCKAAFLLASFGKTLFGIYELASNESY